MLTNPFTREHLCFQTIITEPSVLHENHTGSLRDDIIEPMGHHNNAGARLRNLSQSGTEDMEGIQVKTCRRFVKDESFWVMDKCTANKKPPGLPGGERGDQPVGKVCDLEKLEYFIGFPLHLKRCFMPVKPDTREKSRENNITSGDLAGKNILEFI